MSGRLFLKNSMGTWVSLAMVVLLLAACTSRPLTVQAPVEDRHHGGATPNSSTNGSKTNLGHSANASAVTEPSNAAMKPLPGAENAGKPGYYTVKPGDTLIRIGLDNGHNWRDIARWNALENPNTIEVGQVLRVMPPGTVVGENGVITRPVGSTSVETVPASPNATAPAKTATTKPTTASTSSSTSSATPPASSSTTLSPAAEADEAGFSWPLASGSSAPVLATFQEGKNKGIDWGGQAGDAVMAVADGRVVYAGAGLRGYGNLIILKHNETYLTAYAHNQKLLVKEEQTVRKGQKIAEMGNTDADRVMLHFEVRKLGKPVDPSRYLQAR